MLFGLFLTACDATNTENSNSVSSDQANSIEVAQQLNQLAKHLEIEYEIIDNRSTEVCKQYVDNGLCFQASINLQMMQAVELTDWKIYFSHMTPILADTSDEFNITHVNGDLYYFSPTDNFTGWEKHKTKRIEYIGGYWQISEFDMPPNFYILSSNQQPRIIESTRPKIDPETKLEYMAHVKNITHPLKQFKRNSNDQSIRATAEQLFIANQSIDQKTLDISTRIIPKPDSIKINENRQFLDITDGFTLTRDDFQLGKNNNAFKRLEKLGINTNKTSGVPVKLIKIKDLSSQESYRLHIESEQIIIEATGKSGAYYGLISIASLYVPKQPKLPLMTINDSPRYPFRGLHLDVARNFRDSKFVLKLLDQMAAYKLNKLHLHLGDDEGWRLEIPGLPELTKIGSQRCHDLSETKCLLPQLGNGPLANNQNKGFYSIDDYQNILKQAKARNIEVIPSFDMPGHSRAAVKSMQARYDNYMQLGKLELAEEYLLSDINDKSKYSSVQYYNDNTLNVCRESTYHFIEKVINEVINLHTNAGVPLTTYHVGADETPGAWTESPQCDEFIEKHQLVQEELGQYFIIRVAKFLTSQSIQIAGWSDGMGTVDVSKMPDNTQINAWTPLFWDGHKVAHKSANQGWNVVLSLPDVTYFDFPYEADPKERGYYWGTRSTNSRQVFEFMPGNLPLHAEIWNDRTNKPMVLDDRAQIKSENHPAYHHNQQT